MLRRRREHSLDHPANRWVVGAIIRVRRTLLRTADALTKMKLDALERARADTLIYQAKAAVAEIGNVLDRSAFAGIPSGAVTESVSLILADHPAYARLHRLVRRLLASSIRLDEAGGLEASLRRTWDLFEIDCLFRLIDQLELALGPAWTFQHSKLRHGILAELPHGRFWHADNGVGGNWALYSQQTFPDKASGTASISTKRRPDFVLVRWQGETLVRWVLLDAKYRVSPNAITEALATMHVYRDSLRWRGRLPKGGYLIVPAICHGTSRFAETAYRRTHRFGLVTADDRSFVVELVAEPIAGFASE